MQYTSYNWQLLNDCMSLITSSIELLGSHWVRSLTYVILAQTNWPVVIGRVAQKDPPIVFNNCSMRQCLMYLIRNTLCTFQEMDAWPYSRHSNLISLKSMSDARMGMQGAFYVILLFIFLVCINNNCIIYRSQDPNILLVFVMKLLW